MRVFKTVPSAIHAARVFRKIYGESNQVFRPVRGPNGFSVRILKQSYTGGFYFLTYL